MLNPINTETVIRGGGAAGRLPGEIHEGVAWWMGACLVVVSKAGCIAVAHDGQVTSASFHDRLCRGAVNAEHYACRVMDLQLADEAALLSAMKDLGQVPGALVTTTVTEDGEKVRIALYDGQGRVLSEEGGLAKIRRMIAEDRVPIPVNAGAKGRVEHYTRSSVERGQR